MASRLPNELLHEIFTFPNVCGVDPEAFADTNTDAHPAWLAASRIPLVCKDWYCVATPLVYEAILLSTQFQTRALHDVLKRNPSFRPYIKRLRLERTFGAATGAILCMTSRLTDISISLKQSSKNKVSGLCAALPLIQPTRVVLRDPQIEYHCNKNVDALVKTLCQCIHAWPSMVISSIPFNKVTPSIKYR
jgi:hypothetical protein